MAEGAAGEVPERLVDRRQDAIGEATVPTLHLHEVLPDRLAVERIAADDEWLHDVGDDVWRGAEAVARDALIGDHFEEGLRRLGRRAGVVVALAVARGVRGVAEAAGNEVDDLHGGFPSGVASCRRHR